MTSEALDRVKALDPSVNAVVELVDDRPAEAILRAADEHDSIAIVVGATDKGPIAGALLGSVCVPGRPPVDAAGGGGAGGVRGRRLSARRRPSRFLGSTPTRRRRRGRGARRGAARRSRRAPAGSTLGALRSRCRSCSPWIGITCRCVCGTSKPAISRPTRGGENARSTPLPDRCDTVMRCRASSGSRSSQWSTSARGTTSAWPGWIGLIERKATHSGSRQTNVPGRSPSMMRVKTVGTPRIGRCPGGLQVFVAVPPIHTLMTTAPIAGRRYAPAAGRTRVTGRRRRDQFRPSASYPIPPLRSVADFVGTAVDAAVRHRSGQVPHRAQRRRALAPSGDRRVDRVPRQPGQCRVVAGRGDHGRVRRLRPRRP